MSDTPRTDKEAHFLAMQGWMVEAKFARDLERELTRALRVVEAARALDGHADTALALSVAIEEWEAGR